MENYSAYEKNIFNKIKDIEISLKYYINENKRLNAELDYYKNAYENRVNEYIKKANEYLIKEENNEKTSNEKVDT